MKKTVKLKIALVGDSLSNGGAEQVQARLSLFFSQRGIEVHHILITDQISYDYAGHLLNLGLKKNRSNGLFNKLNRFYILKQYLKKNRFDYIIDFRCKHKKTQEWILAQFIFSKGYIPTIHSYNTEWYALSNSLLSKLIYKNTHKIVAVSRGIEKKVTQIHPFPNLTLIHNPIDLELIATKSTAKHPFSTQQYIVAMGRMDTAVKQFDLLINAYLQSKLPQLDIDLVLIGDGTLKVDLQRTANQSDQAKKIIFTGTLQNPFPILSSAIYTVLTSKNEGFPNVLLESLACGTPVISFDCPSGPNEIIQHRVNGLLVSDQNFESLIEHLDEFVTNTELYATCKANAKRSVEAYDIAQIGEQWLEIF